MLPTLTPPYYNLPKARTNWNTISESRFPWERDALDFVRQRFPDREPYRAWSNFEFIADDGSVNEVDLFVLAPDGRVFGRDQEPAGATQGGCRDLDVGV